MKRENPDLYAALLLGILLHTLLCAQARYGARAGLLALPFSAAALTLAAVLFARAWRQLKACAPRAGGWRPCWRPALHLNFCGSGS